HHPDDPRNRIPQRLRLRPGPIRPQKDASQFLKPARNGDTPLPGIGFFYYFTEFNPPSRLAPVDVMSFRESSSGQKPHQNGPGFETLIALEAAIERSQSYLLSQQKPEGYWVGELMVDSTLVADTIAYH